MLDPAPVVRLGKDIQIYSTQAERARPRVAVFDFDGTLSLIRAGWREVMVDQCVEILGMTPGGHDVDELRSVSDEFITRLTGQQTIYQMLHLRGEVEARGGTPLPAEEYKADYLNRLHDKIAHRLEALRSEPRSLANYLMPGSHDLLSKLRDRGVPCYLASGTDQPLVEEEASLLGLAAYFEDRIYGAREEYWTFSKKKLMARIISETGLKGKELVVFGDGYVEIENGRDLGATTVGIASTETAVGGWDEWKRTRLLEVGAQVLVPDWREADELLIYLYGDDSQQTVYRAPAR